MDPVFCCLLKIASGTTSSPHCLSHFLGDSADGVILPVLFVIGQITFRKISGVRFLILVLNSQLLTEGQGIGSLTYCAGLAHATPQVANYNDSIPAAWCNAGGQ